MLIDDEIIERRVDDEGSKEDDAEIIEGNDDNDDDDDDNDDDDDDNDDDEKARRSHRKTTTTDRLSISSMTTKIYDVSTTDDPDAFLRYHHVRDEIKQAGFKVLKRTTEGYIECDGDDQNGFDSDDDDSKVTYKVTGGLRRNAVGYIIIIIIIIPIIIIIIIRSLYAYLNYTMIVVHPNAWNMMKWGAYDQMLEGVHFFVR